MSILLLLWEWWTVTTERYEYRTNYILKAEDTGTRTKHGNTKTLTIYFHSCNSRVISYVHQQPNIKYNGTIWLYSSMNYK